MTPEEMEDRLEAVMLLAIRAADLARSACALLDEPSSYNRHVQSLLNQAEGELLGLISRQGGYERYKVAKRAQESRYQERLNDALAELTPEEKQLMDSMNADSTQ